MIKKITLITAWILTVSIFNISAQDVSVDVNMPANAAPESTFKVTLTVKKGDVSGFAKLEQILPAGLEATAVDVANSTFSFKDRKAKFLWMSLPSETSFTVSYDVKVLPGTSGNQIFEGTFAYIYNNETQKYPLPKGIINISASTSATEEVVAKVVETPHNGIDVEKAKEEDAAKEAAASKEAAAKAEKEAKDAAAKAEKEAKAERDRAAAADAKAAKEAKEKEAAAAKVTKGETIKKETKVATETVVKEGKPVEGLVFRAQVAAGKKKVSPSVFQAEFKISDEIFWEEHEGWNKYTAGNFSSYRAAKTYANQIRDNNGVNGSFVVAYQNGNRISVQEALNLSGGK